MLPYSHVEDSDNAYRPFAFRVTKPSHYHDESVFVYLVSDQDGSVIRAALSRDEAIKLAGHLLSAAAQDSDTEALGKQIVAGIEKTDGGSVDDLVDEKTKKMAESLSNMAAPTNRTN